MRLFITVFFVLGFSAPAFADHETSEPNKRVEGAAAGVPGSCTAKAFNGKQFVAEGGEVLAFGQNEMTYTRGGKIEEYRFEVRRSKGICEIRLYRLQKTLEVLTASMSDLSTLAHGTFSFSLKKEDSI